MKKRKAVSPVIATLLLILIAVAAAVLVYVWVTGYATSATSQPPAGRVALKIDAAYYTDDANKQIVFYIRNVGDTTATIDYVYVFSSDMKSLVASAPTASISGATTLTPGQLGKITATLDASLGSGGYVVKVVTTDGYEFITRITV